MYVSIVDARDFTRGLDHFLHFHQSSLPTTKMYPATPIHVPK